MDLAHVHYEKVLCRMSQFAQFEESYSECRNPDRKKLISAMNPGKFRALKFLINHHEQRDDKIVVFSDNLVAMKYYASKLDRPLIEWETPIDDRTTMVHFYQLNFADTIFVTKVVDYLLDLEETLKPNVVIQVSCHVGSREKHARRLEGLLGAGQPSFLYILVSEKTDEVQLSKELDIYLSDMVSTFKVVNKFKGLGMDLCELSKMEENELLREVLTEEEFDVDLSSNSEDENSVRALDLLVSSPESVKTILEPISFNLPPVRLSESDD